MRITDGTAAVCDLKLPLAQASHWRDLRRRKARHPYTQRLLQSVFSVHDRNRKVIQLEDMSVTAANQIPGCPFQPRCPLCRPECESVCPELRELEPDHWAACAAL